MTQKVDAVVVTFNRLKLLKQCLNALINQTYQIENIFVIDNNSTDDTFNYLRKISNKYSTIKPVHLLKNVGGAGGFYEGLKRFIEKSSSNYVWIMDDDTIPSTTALEKIMLKTKIVPDFGFLTSNVRWFDGSPAIMNIPQPTIEWNEKIDKGLVKVEYASFVGILFSRKIVLKVGLPIKEFFIWGDDVEYTKRITQNGYGGYLVTDSIVQHAIKQNIGTNIILEENKNRIKRYYFARRNTMYTMKNRYGKKDLIKWIIHSMLIEPTGIIAKSKDHKMLRLKASLKGTFSGIFFNPKVYKFKNFKH